MIKAKVVKETPLTNEEKALKFLESIDWKLWEIYNMMKDNMPVKPDTKTTKKEGKE
jgi:hypothetical protein